MKPLSRLLGACLVLSLWGGLDDVMAQAQTSPAPATDEPPAAPTVGPRTAAPIDPLAGESAPWRAQNAEARAALRTGDFSRARVLLVSLAAAATTDAGRAEVEALEELATFWLAGRYALRPEAGAGGPAAPGPKKFVDRRTTDEIAVLYTEGVLYGLGSGLTLAAHLEPSSPAGFVLPALALAGATEGAIALIDHHIGFRYGAAQAIASGLFLGLEEGIAWMWWDDTRDTGSSWSGKTVASVLWATSTLGGVVGGIYGQTVGTTPGRVAFTGSAALWSSLIAGFGVAAFSDLDTQSGKGQALLASAVALNLGTIGGALLAKQVSPSIARARFIDLGGIAGGALFGGLYIALADRDIRRNGLFGALGAGIATGVATAWILTRDLDADESRESAPSTVALVPTVAPTASGQGFSAGLGGVF
jgi:hypothetical protein